MADRRPGDSAASGLAALGIGVVAIGCCAGLPLLLALVASVGIGTVLGIAGGIIAAALLVGAAAWTVRRRAACETPPRQARDHGTEHHRGRGREVTR
jgi:hypothetical protein